MLFQIEKLKNELQQVRKEMYQLPHIQVEKEKLNHLQNKLADLKVELEKLDNKYACGYPDQQEISNLKSACNALDFSNEKLQLIQEENHDSSFNMDDQDLKEDKEILSKLKLEKYEYCYTVSSLSPNKNYKWIMEEAINNPKITFVISGMNLNNFTRENMGKEQSNVIFTGYVSDNEMVTLMKYCKVFLFPTIYEGFGITPLEAITLGAKIVVSNTPCMHEVYEDSARYINPYKFDYKIDQLVDIKNKTEKVISKYSWDKSSVEFIKLFHDIGEQG